MMHAKILFFKSHVSVTRFHLTIWVLNILQLLVLDLTELLMAKLHVSYHYVVKGLFIPSLPPSVFFLVTENFYLFFINFCYPFRQWNLEGSLEANTSFVML